MRIRYEIEDGYPGSAYRPQWFEVDDQDIRDCESVDEVEILLSELAWEDMTQKVNPCIRNTDEALDVWRQSSAGGGESASTS